MKNLNNLHMSADGAMTSVFWNDDAGNRHHVWLETENVPGANYDSYNKGVRPKSPYTVRGEYVLGKGMAGRKTLYRNAPLKADGSPRGRHDEGHFDTRKLDAEAKVHAPIVTEALHRAEAEGMFEAAVAAREQAELEQVTAERAAKATSMREDLRKRRERHAEEQRESIVDLIDRVLGATDDELLALAHL